MPSFVASGSMGSCPRQVVDGASVLRVRHAWVMLDGRSMSMLSARWNVAIARLHAKWRVQFSVSAYEWQALLHLRGGQLTMGELCERLALTSGAMTGLVDRLLELGLVARVRSEQDRRKVFVELTETVLEQMGELATPLELELDRLLQNEPRDVREAVLDVFDRVVTLHEVASAGEVGR